MNINDVGFTGTRHGMTAEQLAAFAELLANADGDQFHHGDCVGADAEAAKIAYDLGWQIICHPPEKTEHQANTTFHRADNRRQPKSHFARNRDIVNESDLLIACPQYMEPITPATMGGTAYTVNYARKQGKPVWIVRPDGSVEKEGSVNVPM